MKGQSTAIAHVHQASGATNNPRISHALQIIAGNFSAELGLIFPFPHSDFLERSSIWMHLVGLTLANPIASNNNARVIFDFVVDWKDAAALACPDLDHDKISLIKKLPLPLWEKAQYRAFCRLLRCEKAVKIMRHRSKITPDLVAILDALPAEFRRHNLLKFISSPDEAKLINKLFQRFNQFDQKSTADALEKLDHVERFWERVSERFFAEIRSIPTGPSIDDDRVQPILTLRELVSKSREFRNCLSNYIIEMATGEIGFFAYNGSEKAVISYSRRLDSGFVINEIKGQNNRPVSDEVLEQIRTIFSRNGFTLREDDPMRKYRMLESKLMQLSINDDPEKRKKIAANLLDKMPSLQI